MDATAEKVREEVQDALESPKEGAAKAGPVVTEAMVAPLRGTLWELVAEGLPPDAVEEALGQMLARLRVGVEQLRPTKQLAPWMAEVVGKVAGGTTLETGVGRIAEALLPLLDLLPVEHAAVLRMTDHGPLTQHAAAARFGITLVTLKSRVHTARRQLRRVVLIGLQLLAPDTIETSPADLSPDTRAPRRRASPSVLLPAFTTALEDLVRPWVPADHAPTVAASVLARLRAALPDLPNNGRLPSLIYTVSRASILASTTGTPLATLPSQPTTEARSILAPAMRALLADVPADQVEALTLVDLEGRSQHKAARHVGIWPETFKQRLRRARRLSWQALTRALAASHQPVPASPPFTTLLAALQALIEHLAPTLPPKPALQRLLHQLHADVPGQRTTSSLVGYLYAATLSSLHPAPPHALPPADPGPAERTALATSLGPLLATLTPEQIDAFTLFDLGGLSLNAAAAQVGTDRPTFQGRLQRARLRLRQLFVGGLPASPTG